MVPELYVSQTPVFNAGAYGVDNPFIVVHSAAIELLNEDELRVLLAHEMGHVVSGHALYRTIAEILLNVSLGALPFLAGIALLPIRLAILEWSRKSELSSDRAGLLGSQDVMATQQLFMKMAGGTRGALNAGEMNLDAFMSAGQRVPPDQRGPRHRLQDPQHPCALASDAYGARRGAAAVGQQRRLRPDPSRRVHPPRAKRRSDRSRTT